MLDHQDYEGNVFNMADEFSHKANQMPYKQINNGVAVNSMMAGYNFINPS